jgi:hypothetical protein
MPRSSDAGAAGGGEGRRSPSKWWQIKLFKGMVNDVRRRAPYYFSDYMDAWDYRVVPSTGMVASVF